MHKSQVIAAIAAALLAAGGVGLYQLGMHRGMQMAPPAGNAISGTNTAASISSSSAAESASTPGAHADKKPLYWHDPMVPGQKFDKPGKSPFMDMQLVPVYGDDAADDSAVTISSRVQQNLGIRTAPVVNGSLAQSTSAVGSVAYNERDVALVQARSNGFVERLYVRAPFDTVKKGQPLAQLYVPDWIAAQEEFLTARRLSGSGMAGIVDGARQRMRLAGMSEDQIGSVAAAGTVQPRLTLTAPAGGVITELAVREGMTVSTGAAMFRINGMRDVWINAEVPETLAAAIRPGTPVEVHAAALSGTVVRGKVGAILADVNPATRTFKARIELANPSGQLLPGMTATLRFTGVTRGDVLLVPSEAVIQTGQRSVVMVALGNGKFAPVAVEIGAESDGQTEIRKGLAAGQQLVLSGQFLIDSEASLKGTLTRMSDSAAAGSASVSASANEAANASANASSPGASAAATLHHGVGKIEHIDKDTVTISHGPVASLQWGPMTMGFQLPASGLAAGVQTGDQVAFDFRSLPSGQFGIVALQPIATDGKLHAASPATGAMAGIGADSKAGAPPTTPKPMPPMPPMRSQR